MNWFIVRLSLLSRDWCWKYSFVCLYFEYFYPWYFCKETFPLKSDFKYTPHVEKTSDFLRAVRIDSVRVIETRNDATDRASDLLHPVEMKLLITYLMREGVSVRTFLAGRERRIIDAWSFDFLRSLARHNRFRDEFYWIIIFLYIDEKRVVFFF